MIRLLLVDDETLIRSALAALLALEKDFEVCGEFSSGEEALANVRGVEPDVAIVDLQLPGMDGIETCTALMREYPTVRTIIVTSHARPGYLKRALAADVRGLLPKTASRAALVGGIRQVAAGRRAVDPELAAETIAVGDNPLSAREADVLALAADGSRVAEIAQRLFLAEGTVRNYLSSAQAKMGAANRFEAARQARAKGWI
ncbi:MULTISPECIES: response regulator transcription factor [unclassified Actinobaculum]|uniref:response regulator transcription factor n=1 Tax=unclassified Actinobaculum TaxID=2609299 RepID=UPI000D5284BA|nr:MULTISPECIES: response regulator transcription factor [unclassified Actinobaculum]AWE41790.1 DNA-binding response regulator [Actinobaculum sp. 313]RTE50292.1 response regulator transcription factor [Actinobaculum sp. 352]